VRVGSGIALERAPKTDFIVVGPIDKKPHKSTGTVDCLWLTFLPNGGTGFVLLKWLLVFGICVCG